MNIEEIRSKISVVNAESARLNNQRNQSIGRRDALTKQLQDAIESYKRIYGVEITMDNLSEVIASVTKKKEEELNKIETIINLIKAGNISEANKLAGIVEENVQETPVVEQQVATPEVNKKQVETPVIETTTVSTPVSEPTVETSAVVPPMGNIPVETPVEIPVVEPTVATPVTAPNVETPVAPPVSDVISSQESIDMGISALEGFSKSTLGSVTPPPTAPKVEEHSEEKSKISDFSAILNGTAFSPK